jgi:eukaryotic-like serine/threonine-protein kinase
MSDPTPTFPQRIGRYELLAKIAAGGMATVYLGRALGAHGFERVVALKKLHARFEDDREIVAMFLEEGRVAARIRHPNVVPTLDVDDSSGLLLVMEYVEGDQLLGLLRAAAERGTRMPLDVVLRVATDTLAGLHAAHELTDDAGKPLRIVHRDISPQNILVGVDGITKVTDFGIAKLGDTVTGEDGEALRGKLAYMAPEQARRTKVDRRADLFSTAVVLWEALATERLFLADSDAATFAAVLTRPIPELSKMADVPAALSAVVAKGLRREPDERWQTAAEFLAALEDAGRVDPGIAPARRVAEHVLAVSGAKIERERERLRGAVSLAPAQTVATEKPAAPVVAATTLVDAAPAPNSRRRRLAVLALLAFGSAATAGGVAIVARGRATRARAQADVSASSASSRRPASQSVPTVNRQNVVPSQSACSRVPTLVLRQRVKNAPMTSVTAPVSAVAASKTVVRVSAADTRCSCAGSRTPVSRAERRRADPSGTALANQLRAVAVPRSAVATAPDAATTGGNPEAGSDGAAARGVTIGRGAGAGAAAGGSASVTGSSRPAASSTCTDVCRPLAYVATRRWGPGVRNTSTGAEVPSISSRHAPQATRRRPIDRDASAITSWPSRTDARSFGYSEVSRRASVPARARWAGVAALRCERTALCKVAAAGARRSASSNQSAAAA